MKLVNLDKLLPADIPADEQVLWHGRPDWVSLARRAFRVELVAVYFGLVALWNAAMSDGDWFMAATSGAKTLALGALAVALLGFLAWLSARTTLYVITSRRVIMKIGIALPIFFNIPFTDVASAAVHAFRDGAGDIPLSLTQGRRIAYLHLWPHARPFGFSKPEPALRSIASVAAVADTLSAALMAEARRRQRAAGASVATIVANVDKTANVGAAYARG